MLIEGMTICAIAVGATKGYVYCRSEYPHALAAFNEALDRARAAGWLGRTSSARTIRFDIELRVGAGAYVCGEETALLESLEGRRGMVRAKPPLPAHKGLFQQADRHQQRALSCDGAVHPGAKAAKPTPISAWAVRAARCRSRSPAMSAMAACSRRPLA